MRGVAVGLLGAVRSLWCWYLRDLARAAAAPANRHVALCKLEDWAVNGQGLEALASRWLELKRCRVAYFEGACDEQVGPRLSMGAESVVIAISAAVWLKAALSEPFKEPGHGR